MLVDSSVKFEKKTVIQSSLLCICNCCVEELHAEICYAECLLERAVLNFIKDENLIGFIKGSLKIKECYSLYK